MRYNTDTALIEITKRSEEIKKRKSAGTTILLTSLSGMLLLALCFVSSVFVHASPVGVVFAQFGALMMDELTGGYVLSAVVGFTVASGLTVGIYRKNK
ncbi:MAG: hypothetical protein IJJ03_09565 [Mogibacterium sp.]|nr:hypothetical protein [Mogibacterium sp.]MBR0450777.1 hypothetical protein [Oscillospiraceae bacterium]